MANLDAMFSAKTDRWETPQDFFDKLNEEFGFTVDLCADETNAKCERYYTKEQDGLTQDLAGEIVWCNPPYGREIAKWVEKCYTEVYHGECRCAVMLLPARTDTIWFHKYIHGVVYPRFVKGRLRFGGSTENAPFPSMVVVYDAR